MNNNKSGKSHSSGKVLFFLFHELMCSITRVLLIVMLLSARGYKKTLSFCISEPRSSLNPNATLNKKNWSAFCKQEEALFVTLGEEHLHHDAFSLLLG
jgi:hypothetical protein